MDEGGEDIGRARRRDARAGVLRSAAIVHGGGAQYFDCTILDMSSTGARVRLPRSRTIPPGAVLLDVRNRMAHKVIVVWATGVKAGLRIVESHPVDSTLPDPLRYLSRIWLAYAGR
ncbi:MAG: PilZ domain-containing protein [Alphaproteobacteria bacterium]|nr:PilZ domain-containing protein [Alphaproteobacteria bacterium]